MNTTDLGAVLKALQRNEPYELSFTGYLDIVTYTITGLPESTAQEAARIPLLGNGAPESFSLSYDPTLKNTHVRASNHPQSFNGLQWQPGPFRSVFREKEIAHLYADISAMLYTRAPHKTVLELRFS